MPKFYYKGKTTSNGQPKANGNFDFTFLFINFELINELMSGV